MILCFDTETTGLGDDDEILQLSIADAETNEVVLNEYYCPSEYFLECGWPEAEAVTGITYYDVVDKPSLSSPKIQAEIQSLFDSAELVIGYHVAYDVKRMMYAGFDMSQCRFQDPMNTFANWYWRTNPDKRHIKKNTSDEVSPFLAWVDNGFGKGKFISKNLTFAMDYLGLSWSGVAHDSMNDVYSTIAVWQEMQNIISGAVRGQAVELVDNSIKDWWEAGYMKCSVNDFGQLVDSEGQCFIADPYTGSPICSVRGFYDINRWDVQEEMMEKITSFAADLDEIDGIIKTYDLSQLLASD